MRHLLRSPGAGFALALGLFAPLAVADGLEVATYRGLSDASAAAFLDAEHFVVASDEDNVLRVYQVGRFEGPICEVALDGQLEPKKKGREADIEGVARLGDRLVWIGSHGRNKDGKERPTRHRLFATSAAMPPVPGDKHYDGLLATMLDDDRYEGLLEDAEPLAPKAGGVNIEGIALTPEGVLLVGFRSPLASGRALVAPVLNLPALLADDADAKLGDPIRLDLGGLGVRDLAWWEARRAFVIVAGPVGEEGGAFGLFVWSGAKDEAPRALPVPLGTLRPEAAFFAPDGALHLASDDGTLEVRGRPQKELPEARRTFRVARVLLPEPR